MNRLLAPDLAWVDGRFQPGLQIAVGGDGRIEAVGDLRRVGAEALRDVALIPGFVDTHSHAFQQGLRGQGETFPRGAGTFWAWREAMYALVGSLDRRTLRQVSARAFAEMRDAGITTVGEFHYIHHEAEGDFALDEAVIEAARDVGIRLVLLYCYYATGAPGRPLEGAQRRFATPSVDQFWRQVDRLMPSLDPTTQTMGVAPHSIRAASPDEIAAIHQEGTRRGLPVHLHVEEQQREIEECVAAYGRPPMAVILDAVGDEAFTAVHCTHTAEADMARFLTAGGRVCLCPLTEGNLGDGIPRLDAEHVTRGALAIGSDSNNRLAMLEEMRWLEYGQRLRGELRGALPDADGELAPVLLAAATTGGASALGVPAGRIAAGQWADFAAVRLDAPSLAGVSPARLLDALVFGSGNEVVSGTYVGGRWRPTAVRG
jgi:formimidoylglutamate deiminase